MVSFPIRISLGDTFNIPFNRLLDPYHANPPYSEYY